MRIPTPADLRHPGQRRRSEPPDEVAARDAEPVAGAESDEQPARAPQPTQGPRTPATSQDTPTPPETVQAPGTPPAPAPEAAPTLGPTPATLPRPGHRRAAVVTPSNAAGDGSPVEAGKTASPATATVPAPPAPRTGTEPTPSPVAVTGQTEVTEAVVAEPDVAEPDVSESDVTDEAPSPAAVAGDAVRRMIPNPATLMAAGRGMRKVRPPGLRGRRLPKVEETSAGGVVLDLESDPPAVALIARHDRRSRLLWSLPKGHVEEGETPEQAALREVHEETGLLGRIVAPLGVIDFWFVVEDKRIHKTVHHYVIEAVGGELSDEDIEVEAVEWIPFPQVVRKLAYGDERRLVEKVAQIVPGVK